MKSCITGGATGSMSMPARAIGRKGLTAYLADQRIKEQHGEGVEYRRSALQKYATFVGAHADFPLSQFRNRHDDATQAIGYDKSLMLFHMLRRQLGDETFFAGLKRFYQEYRFRPATFGNLLDSLQVDKAFRQHWLEGTGAPSLDAPVAHLDASKGLATACN